MREKYFHQIDILKGILIVSVLTMHAISIEILTSGYYLLSLGQAVPIFLIILGINQSLSFNKYYNSLKNTVNYKRYIYKKFTRIIIPFLIAFMISLLLGCLIYFNSSILILRLNRSLIFGKLPVAGPGNYFISLLLQYTLTFPILYKLYIKKPVTTLILSWVVSIMYELVKSKLPPYISNYGLIYFKYLPLVVLGMWLSAKRELRYKRNYFIYIGIVVAFIFQIYQIYTYNQPTNFIFLNWGLFYFLASFYPAFLFMLSLRFLPNKVDNIFIRIASVVGKASYHIFLVQVIYFAFVKTSNSFVYSFTNIFVCIFLGYLFYEIDNKFISRNIKLIFTV